MLEKLSFTKEFKEKLVLMAVYQNHAPKDLAAKKYGLPNVHMLVNWVGIYKRALERGLVSFTTTEVENVISKKDKEKQSSLMLFKDYNDHTSGCRLSRSSFNIPLSGS